MIPDALPSRFGLSQEPRALLGFDACPGDGRTHVMLDIAGEGTLELVITGPMAKTLAAVLRQDAAFIEAEGRARRRA